MLRQCLCWIQKSMQQSPCNTWLEIVVDITIPAKLKQSGCRKLPVIVWFHRNPINFSWHLIYSHIEFHVSLLSSIKHSREREPRSSPFAYQGNQLGSKVSKFPVVVQKFIPQSLCYKTCHYRWHQLVQLKTPKKNIKEKIISWKSETIVISMCPTRRWSAKASPCFCNILFIQDQIQNCTELNMYDLNTFWLILFAIFL